MSLPTGPTPPNPRKRANSQASDLDGGPHKFIRVLEKLENQQRSRRASRRMPTTVPGSVRHRLPGFIVSQHGVFDSRPFKEMGKALRDPVGHRNSMQSTLPSSLCAPSDSTTSDTANPMEGDYSAPFMTSSGPCECDCHEVPDDPFFAVYFAASEPQEAECPKKEMFERQKALHSSTAGGDLTLPQFARKIQPSIFLCDKCDSDIARKVAEANRILYGPISPDVISNRREPGRVLLPGSTALEAVFDNQETTREQTPETIGEDLDDCKNYKNGPPRSRSERRASKLLTRLLPRHVSGFRHYNEDRLSMMELREISRLRKADGAWRVRMLFDQPKPTEDLCTRIWRRIVRYFKIPKEAVDVLNAAASWRSFTLVGAEGIRNVAMKKCLNKVISREIWIGDSSAEETDTMAEPRPRKGKIVVRMSTIAEGEE